MSDLPLGSDDLDSDDTSSSSSTSTTSSSNSNDTSTTDVSTHSSKAEVLQALQTAQKSYFWSARHVQFFLSIILSTHVLFPHEVTKCSQLGLILLCYKEDDAPCFHQNLQVSPHMFDILVSLIQDSPCFQNNSANEQMPLPSQLTIALFCFSHFSSVASVDVVAQWAGCRIRAVINSTCHVIRSFLLLHNHAIPSPNADEK